MVFLKEAIFTIVFTLFLNIIKQILPNCQFLAFADDLKSFKTISSINGCHLLQSSLDNLVFYLNSLGLSLNVDNCQTMTFTRCLSNIPFQYTINDSTLASVLSVKDLGIIYTPTLDFYPHIESSSCRALKVLGFVKRIASEFKLQSLIKLLYCSLVRSIVEYGLVLWDRHTTSNSLILERVQRRFLSFASYSGPAQAKIVN
ncbi:uncharacterized protein LOC132945646 [Metopolophium dirhodum]|uniref:uncharacterized protein LOC132945646 n=1 Tax=Metopolophium dirhodum TaxID=44670 RepID=UPI0029902694|nr:uncharacterized protein LOC132945646 [Metopolophium dirhodum]